MTPAPGTEVISRDSPPSRSAPVNTGTAFFVGLSDRGITTEPTLIKSLTQFVRDYGARVSYGVLYDAVDVFFREGGNRCYVQRVVGADAEVATIDLSDGAVDTLTANAVNAGDWGDDIDVVVSAGSVGGSFVITVEEDDVVKEVSPDLTDKAAAIAWAALSDYIRLVDLGAGGDPEVGSTTLTNGDDDRAAIVEVDWEDALELFTKDLGPGQVAMPGRTTAAAHTNMLEHCETHGRVALCDFADTAVVGTLTSAAAVQRALAQGRYGGGFAPWATVPGVAPGTTRTVPYSVVQAGLIARSDGSGNNPNVAAAGINGECRYVIGLSQEAWLEDERETLNEGGVNVARVINGRVRTYGYRTFVDSLVNDTWLMLSNARLNMAITAQGNSIIEDHVFAQIDGRGFEFSKVNGQLRDMLAGHYEDDALFGETPQDAFYVDTGDQVNTEESIAAREINAVLEVRMSPFGERVRIEISKVPTTEEL